MVKSVMYGGFWFRNPSGKEKTIYYPERDICVPTMMHSGTHILRFCIMKGYHRGSPQKEYFFNGESGRKMNVFHLNPEPFPQEYEEMMAELPVFTSMRHPYRMWESYKKRSEKDRRNYRHDVFLRQWDRLIKIVSKYDPLYVHVDAPEVRDLQVQRMAEKTGLPLKYDWGVNTWSGSVHGNHAIDVREDKKVPQEFIDFYYETMNNDRKKL